MNTRSAWVSYLGALACLLGCLGTETTNPNGSGGETESGLYGQLVDGVGRPVAGARVRAIVEGKSPVAKTAAFKAGSDFMLDSAVTDKDGRYSFRKLEGGAYNVLGNYNNGGLVVLIPHVTYDSAKNKDLGRDTLRAPGQITGQVLVSGAGKGGIFCYLPGTSYLSISDENGKFWIYNVPRGTYAVKYGYPGMQTATDSGVVVVSGEITLLPPKSLGADTAFPLPLPTHSGRVTIRSPGW